MNKTQIKLNFSPKNVLVKIFFKFSLLFILFFNNSINCQTISAIEIQGNKNFTIQEYSSWIKINPNTKFYVGIEDTIENRIVAALKAEGYYDLAINKTEIIKIDSANAKIRIIIEENNPTIINKVTFIHSVFDSLLLSQTISKLQGSIFSKSKIEESLNTALEIYENIGRPFAKINLESVSFTKDSTTNIPLAELFLKIEPGRETRIDKIEISGNIKTNDNVITRTAGIQLGELYNQKKIDEIPSRLNRLRFFEPVETPEFYFNSKDEGVLKIAIIEKETNNFDGIIGYIPSSNQNEKGFFTGYINVNLRNLLGTGRSALFRWLQENRYSQELEIRYLEPWLFNLPFNVEAGLFQRKQDSTYIQRNLEGKLEFIASEDISASFIINTQSTIPTERLIPIFTVFNSNSITTGLNLKIDTRNDFYSPTKGLVFSNSYKYISKRIVGPKQYITPSTKTKVGFQKLEIDFKYFLKIFNDQIAALGIHARELKGEDIEISDLYLLGGTNTLRGYREKQFMGNRILWSNLEYRYLLSNRSFAFVFFDTGYYLLNENNANGVLKTSEFKFGYGFGLNIETSLGILGITFALGKGDSFGNGKIHFGIVNEF